MEASLTNSNSHYGCKTRRVRARGTRSTIRPPGLLDVAGRVPSRGVPLIKRRIASLSNAIPLSLRMESLLQHRHDRSDGIPLKPIIHVDVSLPSRVIDQPVLD